MAAAAWDEVTPTAIANCFRHAGFVLNDVNATATTTTHTETINKDPERSEMEQLFTEVTNRIPVEQTIDDYLAIDSDVPDTREDLSTEQIVAAVQETVEVEPTEDDTEDPTLPPVSAKSALKAVETLRLFLLQQENCSTLVEAWMAMNHKFKTLPPTASNKRR
ncbi:hypothetical protein RRG08_002377 [Elysia crispata]|uniref:Uncharacterized protein n=1 Tax=Elysia crispata TaxID=231223 RepID=A0AAE1B769_9GAST|nr:hypothetical protein RRG08_002377 [Elysia crispata]